MNISIWGFTESFLVRQWVSYTVDFKDILERTVSVFFGPFYQKLVNPFSLNNPSSSVSSNWNKKIMYMKEDLLMPTSEQAVKWYQKSTSLFGLALSKRNIMRATYII